MIKVLELKGFRSLSALNVFHTLMLGVKMLPQYIKEPYPDFFERVEKMAPHEQENLIREAAIFVKLEQDEVESLICFVADANGVPYRKENLGSLKPEQIFEMIVAVCVEVSKIKVNFVSDAEKKSS